MHMQHDKVLYAAQNKAIRHLSLNQQSFCLETGRTTHALCILESATALSVECALPEKGPQTIVLSVEYCERY